MYLMDGGSISSHGQVYKITNSSWSIDNYGDFNGDGKDDLLFQNASSGIGTGYIMNGVSPSSTGKIYTASGAWSVLDLLDFNGDGKSDILWTNTGTNKTMDYIMNALSVSSFGTIFGAGTKAPINP